MDPFGDAKRSSLRSPRSVLTAAIWDEFEVFVCVVWFRMIRPKAGWNLFKLISSERVHREVVEDVGKLKDVSDFCFVYKWNNFENEMCVGPQESLRRCHDDGFEAVANEVQILDVLRIPIGKQQVVGDLFRAVWQVEQRWMISDILSFNVIR